MALDSELLSAYLDGEIPSPWKEQIEEKLTESAEDQKLYQSFLVSHEKLQVDRAEIDKGIPEIEDRVWKSLSQEIFRPGYKLRKDIWHSRVSIPVPLAAVAALLLFFSLGFTIARQTLGPDSPLTSVQAVDTSVSAISATPVGSGGLPNIQTLFSTQLAGVPLSLDQITLKQRLSQSVVPLTGEGVGVTINLQDVDQLLQLLQGASNIREISIELPGHGDLELLGEPTLMPSRPRMNGQGESSNQ